MYIVWAYSIKDITAPEDFVQHSNQGWSESKIVLIPVLPIPTKTNNKATPLNSSLCGTVKADLHGTTLSRIQQAYDRPTT